MYYAEDNIVSKESATSVFRVEVCNKKLNLLHVIRVLVSVKYFSCFEFKRLAFLSTALNCLKNSPYSFTLNLKCYCITT